jgi:hypothetical protein
LESKENYDLFFFFRLTTASGLPTCKCLVGHQTLFLPRLVSHQTLFLADCQPKKQIVLSFSDLQPQADWQPKKTNRKP